MGPLKGNFKMRLFSLLILLLIAPAFHAGAQNYTLNDDLLYRINFGSAEDVKVLLAKGANPNARTRQGETALNVAMERNDGESERMAEALVEKGADMDTPDKDGTPPLIIAVKYKLTGVVKLMLAKGANYHTNAADGTPLVEYARKYGDKEMVDAIQYLIGKEEAYAESLRTPERFHEMARLYTTDSCAYQYWSYFVASRQSPDKDQENQKKIEQAKARLHQLITEIHKYYSTASTEATVKVANLGVQQIYNELDEMVSNSNRAEKGIGRDEDAKARCEKIIATLPVDSIPVTFSDGTAPTFTQYSGQAAAKPGSPVPLPMDTPAMPGVSSPGVPVKPASPLN
jgi:hypothetical protein